MNKKSKRALVLKVGMYMSLALAAMTVMSDFIIMQIVKAIFKADISTGDASSIGIIGGSDGPTAVFLAANNSFFQQKYLWMLFFLFISGVCFWLIRKHARS